MFFWLTLRRLQVLLGAAAYRNLRQTVLHINAASLLETYGDRVQLAPYNTGSMHVPTAPKRGPDVFADLADYPYEQWVAKRGKSGDHIVEPTVPYAAPDIAAHVTKVET